MIERFESLDSITQIQYGLMFVFGVACIGAAVAPIGDLAKATGVAATFGITVGLWVSHLITVLYSAASENTQ